jgi:glutathione peroxidase
LISQLSKDLERYTFINNLNLSDKSKNGTVGEGPSWNFGKYLIDENGKVLKFFPSSVNPMDKEITGIL